MIRYGRLLPRTGVCRKMGFELQSRKRNASAESNATYLSTKLPIYRFFERYKESLVFPRNDIHRRIIAIFARTCARMPVEISRINRMRNSFESSELLVFLRRQRTCEVAFGKMCDGFAAFGKGSGHIRGGINP